MASAECLWELLDASAPLGEWMVETDRSFEQIQLRDHPIPSETVEPR